ncbi:MAG: hypothetical protein ACP5VE_12810, partial [Chthonomonadales bacterium]
RKPVCEVCGNSQDLGLFCVFAEPSLPSRAGPSLGSRRPEWVAATLQHIGALVRFECIAVLP